jgi:hypothetical protein
MPAPLLFSITISNVDPCPVRIAPKVLLPDTDAMPFDSAGIPPVNDAVPETTTAPALDTVGQFVADVAGAAPVPPP